MYYAEIHSIKESQSQDQLAVEVQLLRHGIPRTWHHLAVGKTGNRILRCGAANSAVLREIGVCMVSCTANPGPGSGLKTRGSL